MLRDKINLKNFFCLIIFILPVYLVKIGPGLNLLDSLEVVFILFFILLNRKKFESLEFWKKYFPTLAFFALIASGFFVSIFFSGHWRVGLGLMKSWIILPFLFSFLGSVIFSKKDYQSIFKVIFYSAGLVATIGLGQYFFGKITFDGRLEGLFNSPNYLAMYLSPGLLVGIFYLIGSQEKIRNKRLKMVYWLGIILIAATLYLTKSYASWAAILAVISFFSLATFWSKSRKIFIVALIILASVFFLERNSSKLEGLITFDSRSSLSSRNIIWNSTEKIIRDNYVFGIGIGNFQEKYLEYQKYFPPYLEWAVPHPHSLYLSFWLYGGIIGISGFLGILFLALRGIKENKKDPVVVIGLLIFSYFLVHGFVDTTYFKNDLAVIFWISYFSLL